MAAPRPPITCHVLDTMSGQPAANMPVTLRLVQPAISASPATFTATTNSDGRVLAWTARGNTELDKVFATARDAVLNNSGVGVQAKGPGESVAEGVQEAVHQALGRSKSQDKGKGSDMVWALLFDVGEYFKGEGFWTEVEIRFKTDVSAEGGAEGRSHWHVPLLLSPWSYTTYRGS